MQAFYGETLGLKKLFCIPHTAGSMQRMKNRGYRGEYQPGDEWISYFKVAEKEFIELFNTAYDGENDPDERAFHHVCLVVADIVAAARELETKGLTLWRGIGDHRGPLTAPFDGSEVGEDGSLSFFIHDPEGNEIELMQYTRDSLQVVRDDA